MRFILHVSLIYFLYFLILRVFSSFQLIKHFSLFHFIFGRPKQLKTSNGLNSPPSFGSSTTPNSPDDMNSALLKKSSSTDTDSSPPTVNMFGKFRGFTLKPLAQSNGPITAGANNIAYVHPVTKNNSNASDSNSSSNNPKKAPPIPKPPVVILNNSVSPKKLKPKANNVTFTATEVGKVVGKDIDIEEKPALPPLNPGQTGRPIISSPILENSTCSRRELNSPMKTGEPRITRPAPPKPARAVQEKLHQRAASPKVPEILVNPTFVTKVADTKEKDVVVKKPKDGQILNRITSFLKKEEKVPVVEVIEKPKPINSKAVLKTNRKPIDRERLKTIEISCPIPIVSDTPDTPPAKDDGINRTQSMRDSNTLGRRPNNYGASMRQAGKRPQSIVGRPNLPPPPRPPSPVKTPPTPPPVTYENPPPPKKVTMNDIANRSPMKSPPDMAPLAHISEESSPMTPTDNIYDEIAESPSPPHLHSTSTESMGLLGEIVSEIENRNNTDALYIASTLRKSKPGKAVRKMDNVYMNTEEVVSESDEEEEYTSPKSIASTTSSGYMRPTGFATPVARVAPNTGKFASPPPPTSSQSSVSSFKSPSSSVTSPISTIAAATNGDISNITFTSPLSPDYTAKGGVAPSKPESLRTYKPYHTTINRPGPYLASIQAKANAQENNQNDKKPVTVRTRTPSPSKSSKQPLTNGIKSPDLIPKSKQPDVVSKPSSNKPKPTTKPTITSTKPSAITPNIPKTTGIGSKYENKTLKGTSTTGKFGNVISANNKTAPTPGKVSHVASLSQKFESGPNKK